MEMFNLAIKPLLVTGDVKSIMNKPVVYTMMSALGECHKPIFTWKAEYNNIIVYGSGSSKKMAKRNAAYNLFEEIKANYNIPATPNELLIKLRNPRIDQYTKELLNPINKLQELCVKRHWELPKYKHKFDLSDLTDYGKPIYEVTCLLKTYVFKGNGRTKRAAKRRAAQMMYNKLIHAAPPKLNL